MEGLLSTGPTPSSFCLTKSLLLHLDILIRWYPPIVFGISVKLFAIYWYHINIGLGYILLTHYYERQAQELYILYNDYHGPKIYVLSIKEYYCNNISVWTPPYLETLSVP